MARGQLAAAARAGAVRALGPHQSPTGMVVVRAQLRDCPVDEVSRRVEAEVMAFKAGGPRSDDVTCLMTRWRTEH